MSAPVRTVLRATAVLSAALGGAVLLAAPTAAAPPSGGPDDDASCVGTVFVPQATGEPGTVARRIAEIRTDILPVVGGNFGNAISGLAHDPCLY